jgi:hypothetical protein
MLRIFRNLFRRQPKPVSAFHNCLAVHIYFAERVSALD